MGFGTLRLDTQDFEVRRLNPKDGKLELEAYRSGSADLAIPQAEWLASDGTLICVIPFVAGTRDIADARLADDVTVFLPLEISEVRTPVGGPSMEYEPAS